MLHATGRNTARIVALRGALAEAVTHDKDSSWFKSVDEMALRLGTPLPSSGP